MEQLITILTQGQQQIAQSQQILMQHIAESQKQMTELLTAHTRGQAPLTSHATSSVAADVATPPARSSQFSNLADRLGKFLHDPSKGKTFTLWYERHEGTFDDGATGLIDVEHKELLLNALGDDEYQRLLSRLSPKKPLDLQFEELVIHLKKQFHDNKTLLQRRFEAFNCRAQPPTTVVEALDRINVLGEAFEIDNFHLDQLKTLLAALALSDPAYKTERAVLFKMVVEKERCTFDYIRDICYAHAERTADVMRVEERRPTEINAFKQPPSRNPLNKQGRSKRSPISNNSHPFPSCRGCDNTNHNRENCPYKKALCRLCQKQRHIAKVCLSSSKS